MKTKLNAPYKCNYTGIQIMQLSFDAELAFDYDATHGSQCRRKDQPWTHSNQQHRSPILAGYKTVLVPTAFFAMEVPNAGSKERVSNQKKTTAGKSEKLTLPIKSGKLTEKL